MDLNTIKKLYLERELSDKEKDKLEDIILALKKQYPEKASSKEGLSSLYAIATAQAKKSVKEDIQDLEEVSRYDAVVTYYRSLGLDPYKLRGKMGSFLRTKIKNSPSFHAWAKINHYESVASPEIQSLVGMLKELKKQNKGKSPDIEFFNYPDKKCKPSDSEKSEAKSNDNFLTPN